MSYASRAISPPYHHRHIVLAIHDRGISNTLSWLAFSVIRTVACSSFYVQYFIPTLMVTMHFAFSVHVVNRCSFMLADDYSLFYSPRQ